MGKHGAEGYNAYRDKLNWWFAKQKMKETDIDNLLEEVLEQHRDIRRVKDCAKKAGLRLGRFITNKDLALYYDIYRGKQDLGYISKGWDDPGFMVGDSIEMDKGMPLFKEKFYDVFKICAKNLISVHVSEKQNNPILIGMDIGIYRDGFNAAVFKEAVSTLSKAMQTIRLSLEF